jgi:hypothetical protein
MAATTAKKNVFQLISQVQGELAKEGVDKGGDNKAQGYKYRRIEDVYNAISEKMAKAGLVCVPQVTGRDEKTFKTSRGNTMMHVVLQVQFVFHSMHDPESSVIAAAIGEGMDTGDKATNKAMSAAHKYALLTTFTIPTEGVMDSEDGNQHTLGDDPVPTTPEPTPPAPPPQAPDNISKQDALNVAMLAKKAGVEEAPFFKWLSSGAKRAIEVGKYEEIPQAILPKVIEELDKRLKAAEEAAATAPANNENPEDFDDDIPF